MLTIVSLAVVAVGAILLAKGVLSPAQEEAERKEAVLTGKYNARLREFRPLQDSELPEAVRRPAVDEDLLYVQAVLFYPGVEKVPPPDSHVLDHVNGVVGEILEPVHSDSEVGEDGTLVYLIYKTTLDFEVSRLTCGEDILFDRLELD